MSVPVDIPNTLDESWGFLERTVPWKLQKSLRCLHAAAENLNMVGSTGMSVSSSMDEPGPVSPKLGVRAEGTSSAELASEGTKSNGAGGPLTGDNPHSACGTDTTITAGALEKLVQNDDRDVIILAVRPC